MATYNSQNYNQGLEIDPGYSAPEVQQPGLEPVPRTTEGIALQEKAPLSPNGWAWHHQTAKPDGTPTRSRRIFGLSTKAFWTVLGLIVLILLGAIIGAAVGATSGSSGKGGGPNDNNDTGSRTFATTTVTHTQTAASSTPTSPCPAANLQNYTSSTTSLIYTKYCNADLDTSVLKTNLMNPVMPDLDSCIDLCDNYNGWHISGTLANIAVFSWSGAGTGGDQAKGTCWCTIANKGYNLVSIKGEVVAMLKGSYDASTFPT